MNRFDIINRIGDKYRVGNTETGEFSYAQALKTVLESGLRTVYCCERLLTSRSTVFYRARSQRRRIRQCDFCYQ